MTISLPTPNTALQAHSLATTAQIRAEIASHGRINFATFMQLALYAPTHGYYTSGLQKFGEHGDFITAPDISTLFSKSLACHVAKTLKDCRNPTILEFGPGRGKMAADILLQLDTLNQLPDTYYCLELSPDLRSRQQATLQEHCPHLASRVTWLDQLPDTPFEGVILANEVLDAMPVHLFELGPDGAKERCIHWKNEQFAWQTADMPANIAPHVEALIAQHGLTAPYQSEINLLIAPWLQSANDCLSKGSITLIDYGFLSKAYYLPERNTGTLMCHYQHRNHPNPFFLPGGQDITAHVDFSCVIDAAQQIGLRVASFETQADFLLRSGITEIFEAQRSDDPKAQIQLSRELQTLLFPHEMGEIFKVVNLTKDGL